MNTKSPEELFEARRKEWVEAGHAGKWVAIVHEEVLGFFPSFDAALDAAIKHDDGSEPLIKQVTLHDKPGTVQRVFLEQESEAC